MTLSKEVREKITEIAEITTKEMKEEKMDYTDIIKMITNVIMERNPSKKSMIVIYSEVKKIFISRGWKSELIDRISPYDKLIKDYISLKFKHTKSASLTGKGPSPRDESAYTRGILSTTSAQTNVWKKVTTSNNCILTEKMVIKLINLRHSLNLHFFIIYILFVSGRRIGEIIDSNIDIDPNSDYFKYYPLKKKYEERKMFKFKPLISKSIFSSDMLKLKKKINTPRVGSNSFRRTLSRKIKMLGNIKPHDLRGFYALYMFKFRNPKKIEKNIFIKKVLCNRTLTSSVNYSGFKINFNEDIIKNILPK